MLEFAADTRATVVGKPSSDFFNAALNSLQLPPNQVLMIGDDMESDILGANSLGIRTCLVQTGKYRTGDEKRFDIQPGKIIESIWNLPDLTLFSEK
jgi:ribonucleotide monophosphatase NagD (HAD superfamily)